MHFSGWWAISFCWSTFLDSTLLRQHCAVTCLTRMIKKTNAFKLYININTIPLIWCLYQHALESRNAMSEKPANHQRKELYYAIHAQSINSFASIERLQNPGSLAFFKALFFLPISECNSVTPIETAWLIQPHLQLLHVAFSISSIGVSVTPISGWYNFVFITRWQDVP